MPGISRPVIHSASSALRIPADATTNPTFPRDGSRRRELGEDHPPRHPTWDDDEASRRNHDPNRDRASLYDVSTRKLRMRKLTATPAGLVIPDHFTSMVPEFSGSNRGYEVTLVIPLAAPPLSCGFLLRP